MFEVRSTPEFLTWLAKTSGQAKKRVLARISNMEDGNFGDHKSVCSGVSETRIHSGPGYRLYYTTVGKAVIVLLVGGDKSSQENDIKRAQKLVEALKH